MESCQYFSRFWLLHWSKAAETLFLFGTLHFPGPHGVLQATAVYILLLLTSGAPPEKHGRFQPCPFHVPCHFHFLFRARTGSVCRAWGGGGGLHTCSSADSCRVTVCLIFGVHAIRLRHQIRDFHFPAFPCSSFKGGPLLVQH